MKLRPLGLLLLGSLLAACGDKGKLASEHASAELSKLLPLVTEDVRQIYHLLALLESDAAAEVARRSAGTSRLSPADANR